MSSNSNRCTSLIASLIDSISVVDFEFFRLAAL
jgi:hypothetical protein